jgi:hypothetical protein
MKMSEKYSDKILPDIKSIINNISQKNKLEMEEEKVP